MPDSAAQCHAALSGSSGSIHLPFGARRHVDRHRCDHEQWSAHPGRGPASSTLAGLTDSAPRSLVEIVAAFSPLVVGRPVTVDVRKGALKLRAGSYTLAAVKG
jgi:hypothetical protein